MHDHHRQRRIVAQHLDLELVSVDRNSHPAISPCSSIQRAARVARPFAAPYPRSINGHSCGR
jgi:hypothetical protein